MGRQPKNIKQITFTLIPSAILIIALLGSFVLMSNATQNSEKFSQLYSTVLVVNVVLAVSLITFIGIYIVRLVTQYRNKDAGSRLALRLVVIFVLLALAPVSVVYYFSLQFLARGIDSWFDVRIEETLQDALELSRAALDIRMRELLRKSEGLADQLADVPNSMAVLNLNELREKSRAAELTLLSQSGHTIASNSADSIAIIPNRPDDAIILQVRAGLNYVGLDPILDTGLHIRVVVGISDTDPARESRILQLLYPIPARLNTLADAVQFGYSQSQELIYLRQPLKYSFIVTLSLVVLLSLLAAVLAAFFSAQRLVAPIRVLAIGTRAVAAGNYDKKLPLLSHDELGSLVQSFNDMTEKIATFRDDVYQSRQQAENERAYLQAVLGRLSSGVLTFDQNHHLRTTNTAAEQILKANFKDMTGDHIDNMSQRYPYLKPFVDTLKRHLTNTSQEWRQEIILFGTSGRKVMMCRGTSLPSAGETHTGYVIVFDDITALIQAERNAAWGEVARRLAHEIKNPLTPIQLSAERIRHKYLGTMDAQQADVLDRSTHTIVQQVQSLKEMVKAFSEYARTPEILFEPLDINQIINEVLDLYRSDVKSTQFNADLDVDIPKINADSGRLRQLLHNLIKNALEATDNKRPLKITLSTRLIHEAAYEFVELRTIDTGIGIPEKIINELFEPYITMKPKGTGLGLAIVKKIVEEHQGVVWAENNDADGACIIIRLPVIEVKYTESVASKSTI